VDHEIKSLPKAVSGGKHAKPGLAAYFKITSILMASQKTQDG
jgi:hypothetical protein